MTNHKNGFNFSIGRAHSRRTLPIFMQAKNKKWRKYYIHTKTHEERLPSDWPNSQNEAHQAQNTGWADIYIYIYLVFVFPTLYCFNHFGIKTWLSQKGGFMNPFRTAVSFWGQLGNKYLEFEWIVPKTGLEL